ncbi:hypothetical protein PRIPAC_84249 [Pristionchus pacificus]|uniref:Mutator-like transposase domain-containing protein n=1 Tax=Pristionchus pacificus TaxID=54126 RepID=A0A2A6BUT5_PRIPA|nr:hypothetical protein PRIPAC_84249 [Pristionchus pacificus]|eukprot:PDM69618.1 hypothetical protein PRIPAC_44714 [Pristionchus pacificus]
MANKCVVCEGPGAFRSFPANSLPLKQVHWVQCLNLLPEESERLLNEWRDRLGRKQRVYWCSKHIEEGQPDPIDRRSPKPSASVDTMPLLSRQLSEVRVDDGTAQSVPTPTASRMHSFPSISRGNSFPSPLPSRDVSEEELLYSSQETIHSDREDVVPPPLPPYLLISSVQLMVLFKRCPSCGLELNSSITRVVNGSALVLKWNCERCDGPQTWSSQPKLKGRFFEGNIKLVCSAHTTALPISRLLDFGHELGLALPAERTMRDYLSKLVIPAVNTIYCNHMRMVQSTVRNTMSGGGLDISMDGRYDSPGFSATNCTVSAVDLSSNLVIMIVNKNKEEKGIENVSGRMEKEGVKEGVRRIHAMQLKIRSICTDNDAKIGKMLREDPVFKGIKHLLDFWHLIKGINHDLRELPEYPSLEEQDNHAYYCHYKYGRDRTLCMNYWIAALPHVTGKHRGFRKIPFLKGIRKCKHAALGKDNMHLIKRDSEEYQELKAVIMKPTFLSGLLRASPNTNTSPNESYNSIINMYAPKSRACSPKWYEERVKLATMHFNNLALLSLLNLREERWNTSVNVIGRQANAVKRKMTKAVHEWRNEVWKEVPCVLEGRLVEQFLRKNQAPTDREYILALQQEEEEAVSDEEGGEGDGDGEDGGDSDASMELGGGVYGEEVDSDREPTMKLIELSDVEDQKSEGEDEEDEEELSSGSEWDEGEAGRMALERGRMRRGRGRGLSRGGTVAQSVVTTDKSTVLTRVPANQEEEEPSTEEGKGEKREKRKVRLEKKARKVVMDESSSESEREKPPVKKGRGKD